MTTSYEFTYLGPGLEGLQDTVASWCDANGCALLVTTLLQGARLRITGPEEAVRDAIRRVRVWIRSAA
jgi:hypothetical protein